MKELLIPESAVKFRIFFIPIFFDRDLYYIRGPVIFRISFLLMVGTSADDLTDSFTCIAEAMRKFGVKVVCLATF